MVFIVNRCKKIKNCISIIGSLFCLMLLFLIYYTRTKLIVKSDEVKFAYEMEVSESARCQSPKRLGILLQRVLDGNRHREVRNLQRGPVARDTAVLVVLAGRRPARLQRLLHSLSRLPDVGSALLVVSHACLDDTVDRLVKSVTFCMVLQLYFPHSVQLYPATFPGPEEEPEPGFDTRDPFRAEDKHHWWWTVRELFSVRSAWTHRHRGPVLFLREGALVLPDALYMLRRAEAALALAPDARLISLGRCRAGSLNADELMVERWQPRCELGLAFNRNVWLEMRSLATHFCKYEDASWAHSLRAAWETGRGAAPLAVASAAPRVLSETQRADGGGAAERGLFPRGMRLAALWGAEGRALASEAPPPPAADWDLRDELLCIENYESAETDDSTTPSVFTLASTLPETVLAENISVAA